MRGTCLRLKEGGPVLGIFPDGDYLQGEIELSSGDALVLFTDGVTEARDASGDGVWRRAVAGIADGRRRLGARELRDLIMSAVGEFSEGPVQDDATLMVLKVD